MNQLDREYVVVYNTPFGTDKRIFESSLKYLQTHKPVLHWRGCGHFKGMTPEMLTSPVRFFTSREHAKQAAKDGSIYEFEVCKDCESK